MRTTLTLLSLLSLAAPLAAQTSRAARTDSLDVFVRQQMALRRIPGLSLAIVDSGRIVYARGYGEADVGAHSPVTAATLFQAGSISKPVSALGALHLVEQGKLSLDAPVNDYLTSWKVPDNRFTDSQQVTLRRLLSHSAGVTVHGFPGYDVAGKVPTLVQVLDGAPPANTAPIRVDTTPGAIWRYSGGGFTIMQQAVIDVAREPFPTFMRRTVLEPIGMSSSSFEQPQPREREQLMATGYYADRTPVRGHWHLYPEMAAAGLWTTPSDLARFAIEVQQALLGRGHNVISPAMARQYLTSQKGPHGLGIEVSRTNDPLVFSHGGRDEGFDAQLVGFAATGQALAFMINANDNSGFAGRIQRYVARLYRWPGTQPTPATALVAARIDPARLDRYAGLYELQENRMIQLAPTDDRTALAALTDGLPDETFLPTDSVSFRSSERPLPFVFVVATGEVTGLVWRPGEGPQELRAPRIGPLPSTLAPAPDPDAALTTRIRAAVEAIAAGGATLANAQGVTAGARKDFAPGFPESAGLGELTYLDERDVAGHNIHRHGHDVARVRIYRVSKRPTSPYLFVHLTADGLVTDLDLLAR